MREIPSLRRLWKRYKHELMKEPDIGRRDLVLAQAAFYTGTHVTWKILGYLVEDDEPEELERLIRNRARQVFALQGYAPRKRRH